MLEFLVHNLLPLAVLAIGGLISHSIKKPSDLDKATHLSRLAEDAASLVLSLNPNADWSRLLADTVRQLAASSGLPTSNADALQKAAAGALVRLGKLDATKIAQSSAPVADKTHA